MLGCKASEISGSEKNCTVKSWNFFVISSFSPCCSSLSGHYKPIGNNSNAIANRLPPPHPSSTGVPAPSLAPPKTSSSSNSFVRNNNRMVSKNGSFNAGKIEDNDHIYESLDIKKLSSSKLPSQNVVGYFIIYFYSFIA